MSISPNRKTPTLCVDFDGVVHRYSEGWQNGEIYDGPMEGCRDALIRLHRQYRLVLCTARHNIKDVQAWLCKHNLAYLFAEVTNRKPAAVAYLDDRAVRFTGWNNALEELCY